MRFAEEILLLLLNEDTGYFAPTPEWKMSCALAGAVLMDLALENRIDSDLKTLTLVDASPTGDELLDPVLKEVAGDTHQHTPRYWIERIAARRAETISDAAFDRLVKQGILDHDSGGYWSLSYKVARTGRYPLVDGSPGEEIKGRITRVLLSNEIPDPRDIAIIGLLHNCGGAKNASRAGRIRGRRAAHRTERHGPHRQNHRACRGQFLSTAGSPAHSSQAVDADDEPQALQGPRQV